jgi:arylsulfatase A-like enzyme
VSRFRRRRARGSALALALALLAGCGSGEATDPQRLVVVTIDTLRADRLGVSGDASAETPNLDALAARGTRFDAAMSPTPLTLPSHTTLFTGMDPPEHGVHHNGIFRLGGDIPTLPERFRDAGWATGAFVSTWILNARFGLDRGFDIYDDQMEPSRQRALTVAERRGDATVDAALAWLDDAPERFFLWVHLYDPHAVH